MKSKALIVIVLVLAVVALSTLTTVAYVRCFGPRHARSAKRAAHPSMLLRGELALSEAQMAESEALRAALDTRVNSMRAELREKRKKLMEELRAVKPDTVLIDALVEEIGDLQANVEKQVIRHMLQEQALLTPEQREKFFSLFHKHFQEREKFFGPRPPKNIPSMPVPPERPAGTEQDSIG